MTAGSLVVRNQEGAIAEAKRGVGRNDPRIEQKAKVIEAQIAADLI